MATEITIRLSRHTLFMDMAKIVARRSTCLRLNVGAVAVKDKSVVGIGYNGAPSGEPHCHPDTCNSHTSCKRTIHAEVNALLRAQGSELDMYVTHSPCPICFDRMWSSGRVRRIFFDTPFREVDHLTNSLFEMEVYRVLPSGAVIDWTTGRLASEV